MKGKYVGVIIPNKFENLIICELEAFQITGTLNYFPFYIKIVPLSPILQRINYLYHIVDTIFQRLKTSLQQHQVAPAVQAVRHSLARIHLTIPSCLLIHQSWYSYES